jgi:hypothetical protein
MVKLCGVSPKVHDRSRFATEFPSVSPRRAQSKPGSELVLGRQAQVACFADDDKPGPAARRSRGIVADSW